MNLLFFLTKASPSHQERGSHDDGRSRRPPPGQADAALPAREQQPGDFSCAVKMQGKPSSLANFDDFALTCSSFENVDREQHNCTLCRDAWYKAEFGKPGLHDVRHMLGGPAGRRRVCPRQQHHVQGVSGSSVEPRREHAARAVPVQRGV